MTYRKVSEVAAALAVRIPDSKISYREGAGGKAFGYVAWDVSCQELNNIFGVFGWSETNQHEFHDTAAGIYAVTKQITVKAIDDATGVVVEASKVGKGRAVNANNPDMAISAADSDALSRAVKKLGDAFGIFLYDKADPAREQAKGSTYSQPQSAVARQTGNTSAAPTTGDTASDAQKGFLAKLKVPAEVAAGLSKRQASDLIKAIKENGVPVAEAIAPYVGAPAALVATSKAAASAAAAEVSIDDLFN